MGFFELWMPAERESFGHQCRQSVEKFSAQDIALGRIFRRYQELPLRIIGGLRISIKGIHQRAVWRVLQNVGFTGLIRQIRTGAMRR